MTEIEQGHMERYESAAHKLQTAVAFLMNDEPKIVEPKHLRVGVNSALVDSAGLARLLIDKGVITKEEYFRSMADEMEKEVGTLKARIERKTGRKIELV